MNRFKTKKKGGKDEVVDVRPSLESDHSFSLFRRGGKKTTESESKKEIDLTTALPSEDDFRTSLLMSGLSARFSMLREQDDPSTKIGKASDDSVLYPKRQSRFADFGFANSQGLGDIAEVESIIAPPFLRKDSTASNESGGIMTRSRPMESNVMFGGRQKIYKIGAGSASSKNLDGMGGRALYDGDVAMSSFQKWRQTEKEKESEPLTGPEGREEDKTENDGHRHTEEGSFIIRSDSPAYNKRRETSSTTSSTPSGGRNSTAATSIVSQPTPASKDGHFQNNISSATSTPALERHGTRSRRLYEQGLNQDLQEQQSSALSRVDTLTRRPGGALTPELGLNSPSPTVQTFADRWAAYGGERRTVMSKGSAPNLRSISPPATGALKGTMDMNTRVNNTPDFKPGPFNAPPLSPPVSDTDMGERPALHIQPSDLGKATAMNMFSKPMSPYDDTKYAERQRQLQQGRETPTQRSRDDSTFSSPNPRSQSSASISRQDSSIKTTMVSVPPKVDTPGQQFHDPIESPILNEHVIMSPQSPELRLERPSDQDHPAFRPKHAPAPLALPPKSSLDKGSFLTVGPPAPVLADSPTLGPNGGLSSLVRQHLRTESDVSSIYAPQNEIQASPRRYDEVPPSTELWEDDGMDAQHHPTTQMPQLASPSTSNYSAVTDTKPSSPRSPHEEDEFANQLANARRRVREKLTSFVETDASFSPPLLADSAADLPPPPSRTNALGILRGKSSRGSLVERGRDNAPRSVKELASGFDAEARMNQEEDASPSLRAFRQARREMQKRREFETLAKHSPQSQHGTPVLNGGRNNFSRNSSRDRDFRPHRQATDQVPPPIPQPPPRSQSRVARERSDSDGSNPPRSRPSSRARDHSITDGSPQVPPEMPLAPHPRQIMGRVSGLPGTDVRRSHILPPNGPYQNGHRSVAPGPHADGMGGRGLPGRVMTEPMPAIQTPASPRNGRFERSRVPLPPNGSGVSGSAPPTPTIGPSHRPPVASNGQTSMNGSTLTSSMKRVVSKKDISEPTFLMSTSRVPTTNLSQAATDARVRSGSIAEPGSPPPRNPRRNRDNSRTRTMMNGLIGGQRSDESEMAALSRSTSQLPLDPSHVSPFAQQTYEERNSAFSISDDEDKSTRRRLRKATSEVRLDTRASVANPKRVSPPQVALGPPVGRAVMSHRPSPNMPGGMF